MSCKTSSTVHKFADGSGNTYEITKDYIEYHPIKPAMSSSGFYDGGTYKKIKITSNDYDEIYDFLNAIKVNKNCHTDIRRKGTGIIWINHSKFILTENCQKEIKSMLNTLMRHR